MTPKPADARSGLKACLRFLLFTAIIAVLLSVVVLPFVPLPWWKVVRRCVSISAATALLICLLFLDRKPLRWCGFEWSTAARDEFYGGVLLGAGALIGLVVLGIATDTCHFLPHANKVRLWRTVLGFIPAAVLVGLLEEMVFRGYLFSHLRFLSERFAIVVSSAIFALVHVKTLMLTTAIARELVGLFILGCLLCLSRVWTGRLLLAVGLHSVLAYGARTNKLLFPFLRNDPAWLIGTSRLINGVVCWAILGLLFAAVWFFFRRRQKDFRGAPAVALAGPLGEFSLPEAVICGLPGAKEAE